ncbi:MAG: hypothetical protein Q4C64_01190 [Erysipelotrichia bacterium]|nr:hypothetical protein [Erysipelotrichia bacterium]
MTKKKFLSKDMLIILIGFAIIIVSVLSLFWTSKKGLKMEIVSFVVMVIGIFISILGYNTEE